MRRRFLLFSAARVSLGNNYDGRVFAVIGEIEECINDVKIYPDRNEL